MTVRSAVLLPTRIARSWRKMRASEGKEVEVEKVCVGDARPKTMKPEGACIIREFTSRNRPSQVSIIFLHFSFLGFFPCGKGKGHEGQVTGNISVNCCLKILTHSARTLPIKQLAYRDHHAAHFTTQRRRCTF